MEQQEQSWIGLCSSQMCHGPFPVAAPFPPFLFPPSPCSPPLLCVLSELWAVLCGSAWYLIWIFLWVFCVFCVGFMWVLFVLGPVWEDPVSECPVSSQSVFSSDTSFFATSSFSSFHFTLETIRNPSRARTHARLCSHTHTHTCTLGDIWVWYKAFCTRSVRLTLTPPLPVVHCTFISSPSVVLLSLSFYCLCWFYFKPHLLPTWVSPEDPDL